MMKKAVFWNMMASGMNAFVSVFLLWIVTMTCGVSVAGVFAIGYSIAQMMLMIGNYGMRNFLVTDISGKYSYREYKISRIVTIALMLLCSLVYVFILKYSSEKAFMILLLCVLKATDAIDDFFVGFFQRVERLDIGGKFTFFRITIYMTVFTLVLVIAKDIILACLLSIISAVSFLYMAIKHAGTILPKDKKTFSRKSFKNLLLACMPLFIASFLIVYLGNAPKYAIDLQMESKYQAYYTYLFMPCYVIGLFVSFALQPLLVKLSMFWVQENYSRFLNMCMKICLITIVIGSGCIMIGRIVGCEVLSYFFGENLGAYKDELTILLIGGGLYTMIYILQIFLIVMRKQTSLIVGFCLASIFAYVLSPMLVEKSGIQGAALSYVLSCAIVVVFFTGCYVFSLKKELSKA